MSSKVLVLLLSLLVFTRFYGLFWGDGNFFHPDESNMAAAVSQFSPSNLNPNFYAYGQFPLYLAYYSLNLLGLPNTFENSVYSLRFWSAAFSLISALVFYYISRSLFKSQKGSIFFLILIIFSPGLIQLAHFGTTESLLILVFALNLLLAVKLLNNFQNFYLYYLSALVTGIGLAAKISALIFIFPVLFAFLVNLVKSRQIIRHILVGFSLVLFMLSVFVLLSPYNLIEFSDFISAIRYETQVANGSLPVFYTNQFTDSIPFIFQFTRIFPYTIGLPVFLASAVGLFILLLGFKHQKKPLLWAAILLSSLFYLVYFSTLYVKWTRFSSPVFYLFPLLSTLFLLKIRNKLLFGLSLFLMVVPGLQFFRLYFLPDTRVSADQWINYNISPHARILSEAGNVQNLPLTGNYDTVQFDFYNLDQDPNLQSLLPRLVSGSDYIIVPSRRVFKNQKGQNYPFSEKYYQSLFTGQLGFEKVAQFQTNPSYPLNSENAEETWSVFDHPVVRIYQKVDNKTYEDIKTLLTP